VTADRVSAPQPLRDQHNLDAFDCGINDLNEWLRRRARKSQLSGAARTFVACVDNDVVGYHCLSAGAILRNAAPKPMQRNMPDPIPVIVLGRLAVDHDYQGQRVGSGLLKDAVLRTLHVAETAGIAALLVHAISEDVKSFYLGRGFVPSPEEPMTLCLRLSDARSLFADQ
jgi:predicted N-acetyltransferase YhbS